LKDRSKASHQACIDATMTPDGAAAPREFIWAHPLPRPRCTTLPRLGNIDAVDEHHSTSCSTIQQLFLK
jgi:hypothetical protein